MRVHPSCTVKKECMLERFEYFKWKREGTTEMNTSYHIDSEVDLNTHSSLYENSEIIEPSNDDIFKNIHNLRTQNPKKVLMGHLNINSIPNKFQGIMDLIGNHLDVFLISETKIDDSFPDSQFYYNGFAAPYRRDRALGGGALMLFVNQNLPSKK